MAFCVRQLSLRMEAVTASEPQWWKWESADGELLVVLSWQVSLGALLGTLDTGEVPFEPDPEDGKAS